MIACTSLSHNVYLCLEVTCNNVLVLIISFYSLSNCIIVSGLVSSCCKLLLSDIIMNIIIIINEHTLARKFDDVVRMTIKVTGE